MNRFHQAVRIVSAVVASWLGMQAVQEAGHVPGAWATGGRVARVVLAPWTISRTGLAEKALQVGPAKGLSWQERREWEAWRREVLDRVGAG